MNPVEALSEKLRQATSLEPETTAAIAADLARLHARQLAGEDVEGELKHVNSQILEKGAATATAVSGAFVDWAGELAAALVLRAIGASIST